MAAVRADWASVINDADDATARLILQSQLDDIKAIEAAAAASDATDQQTALRYFKAELEHHHALRLSSPPPTDADNHAPVPQPQQPAVLTFVCEACGDGSDADHCWQAPCQHWYCDEDLARLFRASMTDRSLYPPRCCRQEIPFEDVRPFFPAGLTEEFAAKREELDDRQPTYCHVSICSAYIGQDGKEGTKATCPACGSATCVLCKQAHHAGDCARDETMQQTEELAYEQGWQRCINCRRMVELTIGCNHITCICRAEFCFVCGQRWKTCACPTWDEARLLARGQQVAQREARADAAVVVEEVRQVHNCDNGHNWHRIERGGDCDECGDYLEEFIFHCRRCRVWACRRCMRNVL